MMNTSSETKPIHCHTRSAADVSVRTDKIALLAQADWLLTIAALLTLPSANSRDKVAIEAAELQALLEKSGVPNTDRLADLFQALQHQIQTLSLATWSAEYHRLFEGNAPCPMNETGWIRRDKGTILADIAGFYRAFGLELAGAAGEKVDYLACELEFVAMLLVMLAKADGQDNAIEVMQITQNALSAFSFDHLGEWLPSFCERLDQLTTLSIYQQLAELLRLTWSGIVTVNQLPLNEDSSETVLDEQGTPYECGMM